MKRYSIVCFYQNEQANFAMIMALLMPVILGIISLSVDYSMLLNKKTKIEVALNHTAMAVEKYIKENPSASTKDREDYAKSVFEINTQDKSAQSISLTIAYPAQSKNAQLVASMDYSPFYTIGFGSKKFNFIHEFESKKEEMKTLEIVFVLDHSSYTKHRSSNGKIRLELIKDAVTAALDHLEKKLSAYSSRNGAIKVSLVPYGTFVNIGPDARYKSWIDRDGVSPIHHENFDWPKTMRIPDPYIKNITSIVEERDSLTGSKIYVANTGGGREKISRLTLYDYMKWLEEFKAPRSSARKKYQGNRKNYKSLEWYGCVEARPYPHNIQDTQENRLIPETFFVPSFMPDASGPGKGGKLPYNDYWHDGFVKTPSMITDKRTPREKQRSVLKYFMPHDLHAGGHDGPNTGCVKENALVQLKDISDFMPLLKNKLKETKSEIRNKPNLVEGLAWAWRVLSGDEPFTEGYPYEKKQHEKFIFLIRAEKNEIEEIKRNDPEKNFTAYGSYGFGGQVYKNMNIPRISLRRYPRGSKSPIPFHYGYGVNDMDYSVQDICKNIKAKGIKIASVSFDSPTGPIPERFKSYLKGCASHSKSSKENLYSYTTGAALKSKVLDTINSIIEDLSN